MLDTYSYSDLLIRIDTFEHLRYGMLAFLGYRYMYLKTYAEFTFCIKSQGHVSDENFLYYYMNLASKISSFSV